MTVQKIAVDERNVEKFNLSICISFTTITVTGLKMRRFSAVCAYQNFFHLHRSRSSFGVNFNGVSNKGEMLDLLDLRVFPTFEDFVFNTNLSFLISLYNIDIEGF